MQWKPHAWPDRIAETILRIFNAFHLFGNALKLKPSKNTPKCKERMIHFPILIKLIFLHTIFTNSIGNAKQRTNHTIKKTTIPSDEKGSWFQILNLLQIKPFLILRAHSCSNFGPSKLLCFGAHSFCRHSAGAPTCSLNLTNFQPFTLKLYNSNQIFSQSIPLPSTGIYNGWFFAKWPAVPIKIFINAQSCFEPCLLQWASKPKAR